MKASKINYKPGFTEPKKLYLTFKILCFFVKSFWYKYIDFNFFGVNFLRSFKNHYKSIFPSFFKQSSSNFKICCLDYKKIATNEFL